MAVMDDANGNRGRPQGGDRATASHLYAYQTYKDRIRELIVTQGSRAICEIGGGRKPLFAVDEITRLGLDYTILDVSQEELDRAPAGYQKVCADVCTLPAGALVNQFDFMFSVYLAEHVTDGALMHRNIRAMLRPGGWAFHYFPTLFSPAFVLNRLLPTRLTHLAKLALDPSQRGHPKFPARYSGCYGPSPRMKKLFVDLGYEIQAYEPFYGTDYFRKLPILNRVDAWLTDWAASRQNPHLTSYVFLVLRKPTAAAPAGVSDQGTLQSMPAGGALEEANLRPGIGRLARKSSP
jgi:SAM-dependent methyltransferase